MRKRCSIFHQESVIMGKNIVILTGSPRKNGNSDLLAKAFAEGAQSAGHKVVILEAGKKRIRGCIACKKCFSKGTPCVFDDDFNGIAPEIEKADVLVISTPIYYFSFTSQIKAAIDKMYSFYVGEKALNIKESVLIACGETEEPSEFEGVTQTYELIANFMQWHDRGVLTVPNVNEIGDVNSTEAMEAAKKLGMSI